MIQTLAKGKICSLLPDSRCMTRRQRFDFCFLFFVLFTCVSQLPRYLSLTFSGDSTLIWETENAIYQIGLGRFMQPVYWLVRGPITAPFLVGLFATVFFACGAFLFAETLELNSIYSLLALCGILATNETLSIANATYLPWTDIYALCFLYASIGVWLDRKTRFGFLISPLFYMMILAHYPSYITNASTMLVLSYMKDVLDRKTGPKIWLLGIRSILVLLAGHFLYAGILNLVLDAFGLQASYDYNGVGRLVELSVPVVLSNVPDAFLLPLHFFLNPFNRRIILSHEALLPAPLGWAFLILTVVGFLIVMRNRSLFEKGTMLFLLLALPLAMNYVYLVSNTVINGLMILSFYFFFFLPCLLIESWDKTVSFSLTIPKLSRFNLDPNGKSVFRGITGVAFLVMLLLNIRFSGQLLLKRELEYTSTLSAMTRILETADQTEGYVPGETPVYIANYLPISHITLERQGFESLWNYQGSRYTYAAAYESSTEWYIKQILGENIRFTEGAESRLIRESGVLDEMERFPRPGYVRLVDGILVIRL